MKFLRAIQGVVWVLLAANVSATVTVENVSVSQREGAKVLEIRYDISSDVASLFDVLVTVSNDALPVAVTAVSGDIGSGVAAGSGRLILWDGGVDFDGEVSSNLTVTLVAAEQSAGDMAYIPSGINVVSDPDFSKTLSSDGFYMGRYEVTKALWDTVANWAHVNGYDLSASLGQGKAANHPVHTVTWYQCVKWCNARSEMEKLEPCYYFNNAVYRAQSRNPVIDESANGYRLPTQEEWEYAARGGVSDWRFPWGDTIAHSNANYQANIGLFYDENEVGGYHPDYYDSGGSPYTSPVGSFETNSYGLCDMVGNLLEWCWDAVGYNRVRKGGSWFDSAVWLRCGYPDSSPMDPGIGNTKVGFRPIRGADEVRMSVFAVAFDARDYALEVVSERGNPQPLAGQHTYAWRAAVTCSVDAVVSEAGTNFYAAGWSGIGSVPSVGTGNMTAPIVLSNLVSSIVWNWSVGYVDADFDGMADAWEIQHFGSVSALPGLDADNDGQSNLEEYIAATDPTNAASFFRLTGAQSLPGANGVVLQWDAVSNRVYGVAWSSDLRLYGFTTLATNLAFPQNSYTTTVENAKGFYRLNVAKP